MFHEKSHHQQPQTTEGNTSQKNLGATISGIETSPGSEKERAKHISKPESIYRTMCNPMTKAVCLFWDATLPLFDTLNLLLQRDEPCIHIMKRSLYELLTDLFVRFVKPSTIRSADTLLKVAFMSRDNKKDRDDLDARTEFYTCVRSYFVEATKYIISKFPLEGELLSHAEVVDIGLRKEAKFASIEYFVQSFSSLKPVPASMDHLQIEFLKYRVENLSECVADQSRVDEMWFGLSAKYPILAKVVLGILTIPHSNADSERVFSVTRKTQTEFRPSMSTKLLESLIVKKTDLTTAGCCSQQTFSDSFLKGATYTALNLKPPQMEEQEVPYDSVCGKVLRMLSDPDPVVKSNVAEAVRENLLIHGRPVEVLWPVVWLLDLVGN